MCMEDVKLGRQSIGVATTIVVSNVTATEIVPANKGRVSLVVSNNGANAITIFPDGQPRTLGNGLLIPINQLPVHIDLAGFGNLTATRWFGLAATAPTNLVVFESLLEREK